MHLFHIPQCPIQNRNVHISVLNGALWDMEQVHSGICEIGQLMLCCRQMTGASLLPRNGHHAFLHTNQCSNYYVILKRKLCLFFTKLSSLAVPEVVKIPVTISDAASNKHVTKTTFAVQWMAIVLGHTSTPIHARAWKEKALAGFNSQQIPTNNNIHKMLIIIISLRWKHFVIISYLYIVSNPNN